MRVFTPREPKLDPGDAGCRCRPMVVRTYRELMERGHPVAHALDAAREVLLWHHPELSRPDADATVSRWTDPKAAH